jgi:hypothetical protein
VATTYTCEFCGGRKFATIDGLVGHLKQLHADREKQTALTPHDKD